MTTLTAWTLLAACAALLMAVANVSVSLFLWKQGRVARKLISVETKRKQAHSDAFERLTDPESIAADMERGADIIEARNANRLTKPREDAGPPARVYRPPMRSKLPSGWNPPRR